MAIPWDDSDRRNEGWYVRTYVLERVRPSYDLEPEEEPGFQLVESEDSMKVWFPVDVNEFSQRAEAKLRKALERAFPNAIVEIE
jgi:hypothetical protein